MKKINKIKSVLFQYFSGRYCCSALTLVAVFCAGTGQAAETNEMEVPQVVLTDVKEEANSENQGFARSDDWQFTLGTYVWGAAIKGETRAGDNIDVSFSDTLENLEMAFMTMFGARKGKWGVFSDVIYIRTEDDLNETAISKEKVTLDTWIVQSVLGYNLVSQENYTLDLVAGARYLYINTDIDVDIGPVTLGLDHSDSSWNGIVGVMGYINMPKQWYASYYADMGTGEAKSTYQVMGNFGYKFENLVVVAGYRYVEWNFDQDDNFGDLLDEFILQGPFVGMRFVF
jgi:hypothetical protein